MAGETEISRRALLGYIVASTGMILAGEGGKNLYDSFKKRKALHDEAFRQVVEDGKIPPNIETTNRLEKLRQVDRENGREPRKSFNPDEAYKGLEHQEDFRDAVNQRFAELQEKDTTSNSGGSIFDVVKVGLGGRTAAHGFSLILSHNNPVPNVEQRAATPSKIKK